MSISSVPQDTFLLDRTIDENIIYAGTDDGIIQYTQDYGQTWTKVNVEKLPGVPKGSFVNDKTVLIGLVTVSAPPPGSAIDMPMNYADASKTPKKGQMGIVDKVFITDDEEGQARDLHCHGKGGTRR